MIKYSGKNKSEKGSHNPKHPIWNPEISTLIKNIKCNKEIEEANPTPHNGRLSGFPPLRLETETNIPNIDNRAPISANKLEIKLDSTRSL